jgi:hypothetical protein
MLRPTTRHHGYGSRTDQLHEVHPQCPGTLSRVFKALQQISVMTHNKIKTCADFTSARVALQNQLGPLQQKRGLRRMFLGSQLLQPPIEVFRDTENHSHAFMVPKRYPRRCWTPCRVDRPWTSVADTDRTSFGGIVPQETLSGIYLRQNTARQLSKTSRHLPRTPLQLG